MKVLLVNGSPRKNGCTNRALTEIQNTLTDEGITADIFWIGDKGVSGCTSCRACSKLGKCVKDDIVNEFVSLSKNYDGFVFGSPVYYSSPNGDMLSFMDRVFYSGGSVFSHKPVASVTTARRAGTITSIDVMNKYYGLFSMPIISSTYWTEVHGNTPDDVEKDLEGLQTMRNLAKNMAWFLKLKQAGEKQGITPPQMEKTNKTNFIRE